MDTMDSTSNAESSGFDRSSRILVLSRLGPSSQQEAFNFVQSILQSSEASDTQIAERKSGAVEDKDEDGDGDGSTSFNISVADLSNTPQSNLVGPFSWKIENRYYSATVHFFCGSLPKSIGGDLTKDQKQKSGVKRTLAENRALREQAKRREEASRSNPKAPDVFEALDTEGVNPEVKRLVVESEEIETFQRELEGVPAVVLLVKRGEPLQSHRDLLNKLSPSLLGFDLEVSIAVGLPSALQITDALSSPSPSGAVNPGPAPSYEDLVTLYAEQGWEYINLSSDMEELETENQLYMDNFMEEDQEMEISQDAKELGIDKAVLEYARRPSLDPIKAGAREETGLDRIKEALETYLWPGLERKDDRTGRDERREEVENTSTTEDLNQGFPAGSFSDWKLSTDNDEDLDLNKSSKDLTSAQSHEKHLRVGENTDEALAKAFLSKLGIDQDDFVPDLDNDLNSSFGFGTQREEEALRSGALKPPGSESKLWKELEDFLKDQDPAWPREESDSRVETEETNVSRTGVSQIDKEIFAELANEAREREKKKVKVDEHQDAWTVPFPGDPAVEESSSSLRSVPNEDSKQGKPQIEAFEDDFSDFVSASTSTSKLEPRTSPSFSDDFPSHSEILATKASIFGSVPSSSKSKSKSDPTSSSEELQAQQGFEFGQAMLAIQGHAERVRSIQDPEKRRREAARIALAFGMGLDEDEGGG